MSTEDETERLRTDIEHTREQLGQTVQALTYKVDVPARARDKLHETQDRARQAAAPVVEPVVAGGQRAAEVVRRRPVPVATVALVLALLGWLVRRRLRR